jgi:hypothetical protein
VRVRCLHLRLRHRAAAATSREMGDAGAPGVRGATEDIAELRRSHPRGVPLHPRRLLPCRRRRGVWSRPVSFPLPQVAFEAKQAGEVQEVALAQETDVASS